MNARTISQGTTPAPLAPRFDRKFIEDHKLVERYFEGKLPFKGARDLENWCRAHPEYLVELKLADKAQASLKLLEASGAPLDLQEPDPPWWKSQYVLIGLIALAVISFGLFWLMFIKYELSQSRLEDARTRMEQGPLVQPAATRTVVIAPDRAPGLDHARMAVSRATPELIDLHVDVGYTNKLNQFDLIVDKKDQGRVMIIDNILRDSNNELRLTLNTSGLSAGTYTARLEAMPPKATQAERQPIGWLILEVH